MELNAWDSLTVSDSIKIFRDVFIQQNTNSCDEITQRKKNYLQEPGMVISHYDWLKRYTWPSMVVDNYASIHNLAVKKLYMHDVAYTINL